MHHTPNTLHTYTLLTLYCTTTTTNMKQPHTFLSPFHLLKINITFVINLDSIPLSKQKKYISRMKSKVESNI
jgi:hypothetical protein